MSEGSPSRRRVKAAAGIGGSFLGLTALIISLGATGLVPEPMAKLLIVMLVGLYLSIGVMVAVLRLVNRLE